MSIEATQIDTSTTAKTASRTTASAPTSAPAADDGSEMSFWDLLDVINPLQQLPIVGSIYREITGDTIKPAARVMGGVLFGGLTGGLSLIGCVAGGVSAVANVVVERETGRDIAGNAVAAALGKDDAFEVASETPRAAPVGPPIQITPLPPPSGAVPVVPVVADASSSARSAPAEEPSGIKWNAAPVIRADKVVHVVLDDAEAEVASKPSSAGVASSDKSTRLASLADAKADATRATSGGTPLSLPAANSGVTKDAAGAGAATGETTRHLLAPGEVPHPTRMPTRDTIPANTSQARRAAEEVAARRYASRDAGRTTTVVSSATSPRTSTAGAATTLQATVPAAANNSNLTPAVDRSTLPDVMMRNLEKYRRAKRTDGAFDDDVRLGAAG